MPIRVQLPWQELPQVPLWVFNYDVEGHIRLEDGALFLSVLVHPTKVEELKVQLAQCEKVQSVSA